MQELAKLAEKDMCRCMQVLIGHVYYIKIEIIPISHHTCRMAEVCIRALEQLRA